jgi:hypothetical protein
VLIVVAQQQQRESMKSVKAVGTGLGLPTSIHLIDPKQHVTIWGNTAAQSRQVNDCILAVINIVYMHNLFRQKYYGGKWRGNLLLKTDRVENPPHVNKLHALLGVTNRGACITPFRC